MGDENDRLALAGQRAHDGKQFVCLLGSEDSGGFIEDQYLRFTIEEFNDLYFLLNTNRQISDQVIGVNWQVELF